MAIARTSSAPEVLVRVERESPEPLARQVERQLREAVRSARLAPGAALPSTRAMAAEIGVARGVVVGAYEQLVAEGYLVSRPGGSTRVARVPGAFTPSRPATGPALPEIDLRPGRPDLREFPRGDWLRSLRRVLATAPDVSLGYLEGRGAPELRNALATYLNRARGTCLAPDDMVISTGFAQGVQLVTAALRDTGARRIGVEDPSHPEYRDMIGAAGVEVVPVPVDGCGVVVEALDALDVDAVVLTPAHQYPLGGVLPPERRTALLAWADRRDATIVEDDYDAEYRYDREPIGAMQGLCANRVVYAGTASKTLAPGVRLGWLGVPHRLVEAVAGAKMRADHGSSVLEQLALADFLERGELDRHLRRMRPVYRRRRDALLRAIEEHLPLARPTGASAGLHVLARLPDGTDDVTLAARAAEHGVGVMALGPAFADPGRQSGLIFGYAATDERRIVEGVRRLAPLVG
jgi:GntR family transcriptional regulator / MocR family aminotransferase